MWWTKEEKEVLDDLYESAIGSDNADYILEKLSEIFNIIWKTQITGDEKNWKLIAIEKEENNG